MKYTLKKLVQVSIIQLFVHEGFRFYRKIANRIPRLATLGAYLKINLVRGRSFQNWVDKQKIIYIKQFHLLKIFKRKTGQGRAQIIQLLTNVRNNSILDGKSWIWKNLLAYGLLHDVKHRRLWNSNLYFCYSWF